MSRAPDSGSFCCCVWRNTNLTWGQLVQYRCAVSGSHINARRPKLLTANRKQSRTEAEVIYYWLLMVVRETQRHCC